MNAPRSDKELNNLIYKAIVPKGLRPANRKELDAMLDATSGDVPSEESIQQMLRKIRGEEPIGHLYTKGIPAEGITSDEVVDISEEAIALYRNQGENIPPEIEEKLKEMEEHAQEENEEDDPDTTDE
jgi:hypothetical protein